MRNISDKQEQEWHEFSGTPFLPMLGWVISFDDFTRELYQ